MRDRLRRLVETVVGLLPSGPVEAARRAFVATEPDTARHRALRLLLGVLRHRGIPTTVESFVLLDDDRVTVVRADSFIAVWLYWFGERFGYEAAEIVWWRRFVRASHGVLDLGANIGYYSLQAATVRRDIGYVAVEPFAGSADVLRRNLAANRITHVQVVQAAAMPTEGPDEVELLLPRSRDHYRDAPCSPFIMTEAGLPDIGMGPTYEVTAVTVATVSVATLLTPQTDLLKIDVEGFELELLEAMVEHLRRVRPTIFVELLDSSAALKRWIVEVLEPIGYRCFVPQADGLVELGMADLVDTGIEARGGTRDVIVTCLDPHALPTDPERV